jgi:hypothetical protein
LDFQEVAEVVKSHEKTGHGKGKVDVSHGNLKCRRNLKSHDPVHPAPVVNERKDEYSHARMDKDVLKFLEIRGHFLHEEIKPEMGALHDPKGCPKHRDPDEEIACQLFGPRVRLIEDIAEEDLAKHNENHESGQEDQGAHLQIADCLIDAMKNSKHRFLARSSSNHSSRALPVEEERSETGQAGGNPLPGERSFFQ